MTFLSLDRIPNRYHPVWSALLISGIGMAWTVRGFGQNPSPAPNAPYVSPTAAASGMTSGLENGATQGTIQMMQVRAAAHEAERAAAAAALARTANAAIEEENLKNALQRARETRRQKMEMAERLKWERATAHNAYNKVTRGQMQSWKDQAGNVKVERGLPPDFVVAMQQEEAARAAAAGPKRRGFGPLKVGQKITDRARKAVGAETAGRGTGLVGPKPLPDSPPPPPQQVRNAAGSPPKIRAPKIKAPKFSIPKFGRNRGQGNATATEGPQVASQADQSQSSAPPQAMAQAAAAAPPPSNAAPTAASPKPPSGQSRSGGSASAVSNPVTASSIPARSGAELLKEETGSGNAPGQATPAKSKKIGNLFARNASSKPKTRSAPEKPAPSIAPAPRKFRFGKKKEPQPQPGIDTGLFPTGTVISNPNPNPPSRTSAPSNNIASSSPPPAPASSNNSGMVVLPGSSPPEPEKKRFSLPKPKIPTPKKIASATSGSVSPSSTVNRNGNSYYIVGASSQFMKYGASRSETQIIAVPSGTTVLMTKPGTDWATVRLPDGSSGVIQTKNLRAASSNEVPSGFAPPSENYATSMSNAINSN